MTMGTGKMSTMKSCDCMFLSKTWMSLKKLHTITSDLNKMNYWCNKKTSIDIEIVLGVTSDA